ncbi:hypothetical protein LCGC14_0612680 [marine sediment metagenome]|uniref:Uncharacterized protein n=1 Tax=marine sediment metagenome TaxID=412755 RepID=A0A0F9RBY6_9ZZZZ
MDKATELLIKLMKTMKCDHLNGNFKHHDAHGMYVCDECDDAVTTPISPPVIKEIKAHLDGINGKE